MVVLIYVPILFGALGIALCAPSEISCPAPVSPEHGQAFVYEAGQFVKYVCEPGYELNGKEISRCVDGQWEDENPICLEIALDALTEASGKTHVDVDDVKMPSLPKVNISQDDEGMQADDPLRHLYWHAYHNYPSYSEYYRGHPRVMTLTSSQLAWIDSLHPELREEYLKGMHVVRADDSRESERTQAYLRSYEDAYNYNYYYHLPYYRKPMSLVVEDPIASYDYSCHVSGHPFIKAPKLPNMHVYRYDRRQNPNSPNNNYLSAIYRCNPGFVMLDTRDKELHCSKKGWVGIRPVCVRKN